MGAFSIVLCWGFILTPSSFAKLVTTPPPLEVIGTPLASIVGECPHFMAIQQGENGQAKHEFQLKTRMHGDIRVECSYGDARHGFCKLRLGWYVWHYATGHFLMH